MKNKFIQTLSALILPISFIVILTILNAFPMPLLSIYGFGAILVTGIAIFITYLTLKKDKKSFKDIGLHLERKTPKRFIIGFSTGLFVTTIMLAIVINFSNIELINNTNSNTPFVLLWLLIFFPLAFMEELIFRGYAFIQINKRIGLWPAQIVLALLFAYYHDFTGVTFFNQLLGPGIWALIFGIAAIWSKGLAFPTGLHMAINVVLALVGEKDDKFSIWTMEYAAEVSPILKAQAGNVGLIMQLCILAIAIILTELYRIKSLKTN